MNTPNNFSKYFRLHSFGNHKENLSAMKSNDPSNNKSANFWANLLGNSSRHHSQSNLDGQLESKEFNKPTFSNLGIRSCLLFALVATSCGFLGAFAYQQMFPSTQYISQSHNLAPVNTSTVQRSSTPVASFAEASSRATSSVAYIKTTSKSQMSSNWFDFFFQGGPQTQMVLSSGSGVIYSKDGYIITNNHVIDKADKIEVVILKQTYQAQVVGTDPSTDLAILKIEAHDLPAIALGTSQNLQVGDWVLAVGNPFNLTSTVTAGIVSAKGRNINIMKGRFPIESFIQTDAAINPGNSGGALVNSEGALVGINTAILSQTGSYAGYGFAVPVEIAQKVAQDLIEYKTVQTAYMGADVEDINSQLGEQFKLKSLEGVVVTNILKGGAAERIGMQKGDVIVEIDQKLIDSKSAYMEIISYHRPGDKVKVKFKREDIVIEGSAHLTNVDGTTGLYKKEIYTSKEIGADLESISSFEKQRLNIQEGVKIGKILTNGLIARMGIEEGFILTSINGKKMNKGVDVAETLGKLRGRVIVEGITENGQRGYYSFYF